MGTLRTFLALAAVISFFGAERRAQAQSNIYTVNIVGYVNVVFLPGGNLFGNPLDHGTNTLSHLFYAPPEGATVSLWDAGTMSYDQSSTYSAGAWTVDLTLYPGTGALLTSGSVFTNTFVGNVLYTPGPEPTDILPATLFNGEPGLHLLSSVTPVGYPGQGYSAFDVIIGRAPITGDQFTWLDEASQTYHTTTYNSTLGEWDNGEPGLNVGEAAFFNVMPVVVTPVPEPSTATLLLAGAVLMALRRRRCREST